MYIETPMTAAELIARLQTVEPNAVVMLVCEDEYYNCPMTSEHIDEGRAVLIAPHDYIGADPNGRPRKQHSPGGWRLADEDEENNPLAVEGRRSVIIRVG